MLEASEHHIIFPQRRKFLSRVYIIVRHIWVACLRGIKQFDSQNCSNRGAATIPLKCRSWDLTKNKIIIIERYYLAVSQYTTRSFETRWGNRRDVDAREGDEEIWESQTLRGKCATSPFSTPMSSRSVSFTVA